MDGLECSEVLYSFAKENKDCRIDSQFFTAKIKHNGNLEYCPIGKYLISSQYGVSKDMNTEGYGYPIFRMNEIHHSLCDLTTEKFVELSNEEFYAVKLNDRDVLFNRTNSFEKVGRTGVYYSCGIPQTFASYREGRKVIMEQYPEYYLWDFYHVNEDFEYTFKDIPPDKSDCLIIGLKISRNRGTKWQFVISGFARFFGKYYEEYNGNVQFQCNISGILESSTEHVKENPTESEQDYLSWLLREINVALTHSIVEAFKLHYENNAYGKRLLVKIGNLEKRIISLIWQIFDLNAKDETFKTPDEMGRSRNTYELIQQRPLNYFQYHFDVNLTPQRDLSASEKEWFRKLHESRRQNSVLWFLDFVYRLRNALFHEIIDPLDEEWQVIFKNAYLVLKEIVDLNIAAIETR